MQPVRLSGRNKFAGFVLVGTPRTRAERAGTGDRVDACTLLARVRNHGRLQHPDPD
jgi:hypothetical protein